MKATYQAFKCQAATIVTTGTIGNGGYATQQPLIKAFYFLLCFIPMFPCDPLRYGVIYFTFSLDKIQKPVHVSWVFFHTIQTQLNEKNMISLKKIEQNKTTVAPRW